jgi:DNA-binding NarL/FixJ family response regulator
MSTDGEIRVLVCDDHPVYRDGLAMLLDSLAGITVVGTAADGIEALERVAATEPDVVVMDVQMPRLNGVEATARLTAEHPHLAVLVLTMYEDDETVFAAMRAGARGYLLKGAAQDKIARAVQAVAGGEAIFGPAVARRVADYFAAAAATRAVPEPARPEAGHPDPFPQLTEREREVLDLLAAGCSNPQIAERLFLSPKTVRNNVSNIFAKLQVAGRAEAIVRARDAGLGR